MYLQSLEMIGFKSFAPRTILSFHRGVTAVVGPNGCGKSNVLDAIRWVLGEQSAKALRGGEMADVIFSGTDSRQALGMAEVSLTFAECEKELGVEWNEVCISRRVYRDGKSEYFLNKAPCRLRDIHQLFMDTGVGRSAYSIMEQGKIDLILSSRPEDRRAIFEEAAGITKYKAQKKEALRKLEYTEANLLRVQDIIKEVRRQIGSLQRQAAKARRYQALMKDLKILDTHLSHKNYRELSSTLEQIRRELVGGEDARAIHESEIAQQEVELSNFRARMEALDNQASRLRDGMQGLKSRIFSAENRITTNAERCEEARLLIERHRIDIAAAGEKMRVQQDQIEQTDQLLAQMIEVLRAHEASFDEHTQKVRAAREERVAAERQIQDLGTTVARLDARLGSLRNEISAAAGRREAAEARSQLLHGESEAVSRAAEETRERLEEIGKRAELARLAVESARAEQSDAQNACETAQVTRQAAEAALNAVSKEAAGIESRVEVLRQLQEQGEGFDEGTQAILRGLENPDFFKSAIHGTLADQIQVEPRYIPAIEAALGAALQAIIFKDTAVAELALQELSRRRLGKATIAPREWIPKSGNASKTSESQNAASAESARWLGNPPDAEPAGHPILPEGAIDWASACVAGEGEGGVLAARLLYGIVVVENLESAFRIKAANLDLGVATLDGEFISREGFVSGGRTGENGGQSALARRAQIAQLEGELTVVIRRLESQTAIREEALQALEASQNRLLSAREGFHRAQVESGSIQNEQKLAERQLADFENRRAAFLQETVQLGESLRASLAHLENLESAIAETVQSLEHHRTQREEAERAAQAVRERENVTVEDLNEIRIRVATERQQQENLNNQRAPMAARLAELGEFLKARGADIAGYEARIETLEAESSSLNESIAAWRTELTSLEAEITELSSARSEVHQSAAAVEIALRSARQQLVQLQEQKGRLEVRLAQIEMRMENQRNHVSHRYQTELEAFEPDTYALLCSFRDRNKRKPSSHDAQAGEGSGEERSPEPPPETAETQGSQAEQSETINWDRIEELVADLTERVEAMGPVNLDAIQEYDELEQRQVFLEKQNADLVNSKAELHAVIAKINRTTRELFAETFAKIRENFQIMFTELFGGGRANLLLMDESDPLECGIEIIAKPPGKQLQSVSLLSGGERTMTAVSLLFAIYMVKPSPFCVLDEMDAPLDESNINRFIKILDRFVGQSQFVVITHNKRTISRADVLYGVTMEEQGVSKLFSVKFTTKEELAAQSQTVAEAFDKAANLESDREPATA
ncbi:MAG TPA: chromosome segregation protein SMC [Terrimicrobiaceae bacterium]